MTILVDEDGCIACGQCMEICPEVFKPRPDGKAYAAAEDLPPEVQTARLRRRKAVPFLLLKSYKREFV